MKKIMNFCALGVFLLSSLMFFSCANDDDDDKVKDYSFTAKIEQIENEGVVNKIGKPVKLKISLNDVKTKADSIEISFKVNNRNGYVYKDKKKDLHYSTETVFRDVFADNTLVLYYVPENGGKQTLSFKFQNGKYAYDVEKEIDVETGTNVSFSNLLPKSQTLGQNCRGSVIVDNYMDKGNYHYLKYEITGGNLESFFYIYIDGKPVPVASGKTVRLMDGIKKQEFNYIYEQKEEGYNTIKLTVGDKYGNEYSSTFTPFFSPIVDISIYCVGVRQSKDHQGISPRFFMTSTFINTLNERKPYVLKDTEIEISFTVSTQHPRFVPDKRVVLKIPKNSSVSQAVKPQFFSEIGAFSVKDLKIIGMADVHGRVYKLTNVIKYSQVYIDEKGKEIKEKNDYEIKL